MRRSNVQLCLETEIFPTLNRGDDANKIILNQVQAIKLETCLLSDSKDYLYSSIVSFANATHCISSSHFSWSVVSLYYSVFYACRAILAAAHKIGLFYFQKEQNSNYKPYSFDLNSNPGNPPLKESGTTHELILKLYQKKGNGPTHNLLLGQEINLQSPMLWLKEQRENVNYRQVTFTEPDKPDCLISLNQYGIRKLLAKYLDDIENATYLYTFDPNHAAISYPLLFLSETVKVLKLEFQTEPIFSEEKRKFLEKSLVDEHGNRIQKLHDFLIPRLS